MTIFCTIQFDNLAGSLAALVLTATTFPMVGKNESAEFPLKMALSQPSQLAQLFIRKLCNFIGDSFGSLTKCYYLLITWKESAKLYICIRRITPKPRTWEYSFQDASPNKTECQIIQAHTINK